jgi:hypothetical protein
MILALLMIANECQWSAKGPKTREPRVLIDAPESQRGVVIRALATWAAVTDIRWHVVTDSPDLTIRARKPGECGNVTAMAGGFATDTHVIIRDWDGPRTSQTIIHEVGHWLGLHHNDAPTSAMYPMLTEQRYEDIDVEDEAAIREKLGPAEPDKWTVREQVAQYVARIWGVGKKPPGGIGRGWSWFYLCGGFECVQ